MKSKSTIEVCNCLACLKSFYPSNIRSLLEREPLLCNECLKALSLEKQKTIIEGVEVTTLYKYDGILKEWLLNYKERLDFELAPVFLYVYAPLLKITCKKRTVILVPSSDEKIKERGFNHLEEIIKAYDLPYLNILKKENEIIQKEQSGLNRLQKMKITVTDKSKLDPNKSYLLFDDVITTKTTFLCSLDALKKAGVKRVKGLVLMDNQNVRERKLL